ncbi:hypothetical protein FCV25MIE_29026 [Fagus crenata]
MVDLLVKHIDKWEAESREAKEIAMILQHARVINTVDIQVCHNITVNMRNNPPHPQAPGRGRGSRYMNVDPSASTQPTPSMGDGPSAAPCTSAQPPLPMNFGPSGTPFSIAQSTPSTSACPSNGVASSTHKRRKVAPSPLNTSAGLKSAPLITTHLPPSIWCHLDSTPTTPIYHSSSTLPTSPEFAPLTTTHLPPLRGFITTLPQPPLSVPIQPHSPLLPTLPH